MWDSQNDKALLQLVEKHGKKWSVIVKTMPECSAKQLKLRYFYLEKNNRVPSQPEKGKRNTPTKKK